MKAIQFLNRFRKEIIALWHFFVKGKILNVVKKNMTKYYILG